MIRSHICFIQKCGMVLKLDRFFHLSGQSFGLSFLIGLETLSGSLFILKKKYIKYKNIKNKNIYQKKLK